MFKKTIGLLASIWIYSLSLLLLLAATRCIFVYLYIPKNLLTSHSDELANVIATALRFDMQTIAYIALLPLMVAITASFFPKFTKAGACYRWYYTVVFLLLVLLGIIDLGYFATFGMYISITFFDFFNEGPWSIIQTIWSEYPVIKLLALLLALGLSYAWFAKKVDTLTGHFPPMQ